MPIYTCTTALGTLTAETKAALAGEVTRIHAADNHVPPEYVNVVFQELPTDAVFIGGQPGAPILISGWARRGHPQRAPPDWPCSCPPRLPASHKSTRAASWS